MTPSIFHLTTPLDAPAPLEQTIANTLSLNSAQVHEIDFEDLMLKESVMKTIGSMAGEIIRRLSQDAGDPGTAQAVQQSLQEKAYWIEETRELVLAVVVADETHLIQVPKESWMVTERSTH